MNAHRVRDLGRWLQDNPLYALLYVEKRIIIYLDDDFIS